MDEIKSWLDKIHLGDAGKLAASMPSESVDLIVTSPPYWSLRDYDDIDDQLGLEETPELFVDRLATIFDEIFRVLKPSGNTVSAGHQETTRRFSLRRFPI